MNKAHEVEQERINIWNEAFEFLIPSTDKEDEEGEERGGEVKEEEDNVAEVAKLVEEIRQLVKWCKQQENTSLLVVNLFADFYILRQWYLWHQNLYKQRKLQKLLS